MPKLISALTILFVICIHLPSICCFSIVRLSSVHVNHHSRVVSSVSSTKLFARVAKKEDEKEVAGSSKVDDDEMITIPFTGLIGKEQGSLFDKPLDLFDPMKNTDDLPGKVRSCS